MRVDSTWPLGPGDELLGELVRKRRFHSVTTAARETGVDPRRLRKQLTSTGLLEEGCSLPDAWAVFDADEAAPVLSELKTLIPATEFRRIIGASRSQFDLLVADGVLEPALQTSATKAVWDPVTGTAFVDRLLKGAVPLRQLHDRWEHISKSAQRLKIRPSDIIDAIFDGRLRSVGRLASRHGYSAVHVNHAEVAQLLAKEDGPGRSIETFAKSIGANSPAGLRRLVQDGHTPATLAVNPRTRAKQLYFTIEDEEAFHTKYFTPRTMADAYQESWQSLGGKLRRLGVTPFAWQGEDYGRIFLRDAVERALVKGSKL